jgi:hypothetical protein
MTRRERATFFNRIMALREAYEHLGDDDRVGTTTIEEALVDAELELELMAIEAEAQTAAGEALRTDLPA